MAKQVFTNGYVNVNAVDLSNRARSASVTSEKDVVDATCFGATNKQNMLGLGDGTISVTFAQDYAAGSTDATLYPIHANSTEVVVEVRPVNAARSATNPGYVMTGVLPSYTGVDGSVGDLLEMTAEFTNSGASGIARLTA